MIHLSELIQFSHGELVRFLLILARVSPLMVAAPVFGSDLVPARVRLFLALLVTVVLLPVVRVPVAASVGSSVFSLALAVGLELLLGLVLAYVALLLFAAAQFAGQLIDISIGFGMANVIDPLTSAQVTLIGQLQYLAALFVFLMMDGHHLLLHGLAGTFEVAPLGQPLSGAATTALPLAVVVERGGRMMFLLAAQIAGPTMTAVFLSNLAMGLTSRMLPQMNIFLVGLPLNIFIGLLSLAASLSIFTSVWRGAMSDLQGQLGGLVGAL